MLWDLSPTQDIGGLGKSLNYQMFLFSVDNNIHFKLHKQLVQEKNHRNGNHMEGYQQGGSG